MIIEYRAVVCNTDGELELITDVMTTEDQSSAIDQVMEELNNRDDLRASVYCVVTKLEVKRRNCLQQKPMTDQQLAIFLRNNDLYLDKVDHDGTLVINTYKNARGDKICLVILDNRDLTKNIYINFK